MGTIYFHLLYSYECFCITLTVLASFIPQNRFQSCSEHKAHVLQHPLKIHKRLMLLTAFTMQEDSYSEVELSTHHEPVLHCALADPQARHPWGLLSED